MDLSFLKEIGLTEGEIKVYLALLELGASTTGPIIEKANISRSIIYQILDKLIEKGLVSFITKEKTKYFQATQPKHFLDIIEKEKENLTTKEEYIKDFIKNLEQVQE